MTNKHYTGYDVSFIRITTCSIVLFIAGNIIPCNYNNKYDMMISISIYLEERAKDPIRVVDWNITALSTLYFI